MKNNIFTAATIAAAMTFSACHRDRHPQHPTRVPHGPSGPADSGDEPEDSNGKPPTENLPDPNPTTGNVPPPPPSGNGNVIPPPPQPGPAPYGVKVDGKPGFISSPYASGKLIDVRGLPPGTEIECPYTNRPILVP